jgi:hypothetical protein
VDKPRGNIDAADFNKVFQQFISRPHLFFQKSPLKHPPQVIDSVRPRIAIPIFRELPVC